jgi:hypothetical protein
LGNSKQKEINWNMVHDSYKLSFIDWAVGHRSGILILSTMLKISGWRKVHDSYNL